MIKDTHIRGFLIAFAVVIVAVNLIVSAASSPLFCSTCHRSQAVALERSPHSLTRCNACHQRNDMFDIFSWRARVLGMVARQVTFTYKRPITADVSQGSCLRCHDHVLTEVVKRKAIRISHKEINDASYKCTDCHNTVGHPGAVTNPKYPEMGKCSTCHNNNRVNASCDVCHMKEVDERRRVRTSWSVTHGPQWQRLHGMGNLNTCATCHDSSYCRKCHNTTLPHPDFWVRLHPRDAKDDVDGCYQCHHKAYCLACHGTTMPHDNTFLRQHGSQVKKNGKKVCVRCHLDAGCDRCHARHIHPGLLQERIKELRRGAGLDQ